MRKAARSAAFALTLGHGQLTMRNCGPLPAEEEPVEKPFACTDDEGHDHCDHTHPLDRSRMHQHESLLCLSACSVRTPDSIISLLCKKSIFFVHTLLYLYT